MHHNHITFLSSSKRSRKSTQVGRCELANTDLRWVAKHTRFNASSKKAISVQPYAHGCTNENNTEANLRRLALGLRSLARKFELDQRERKSSHAILPSQVHASRDQTESQVTTSFQFGPGQTDSQVTASWKLVVTCRKRLRLATACVDLPWLAMTCVHFDRAQVNASFSPFGHPTQVDASFSPLGHPTQVDASWSQYCFPLYGCAWKAALKWPFCYLRWTCMYLRGRLATHPYSRLYSQVPFPNLRWLATPFGQGLTLCFAPGVQYSCHQNTPSFWSVSKMEADR